MVLEWYIIFNRTRTTHQGLCCVNPIQDGVGGKMALTTSFSSVTSVNVGISPQNFLTFSFNPFATLV